MASLTETEWTPPKELNINVTQYQDSAGSFITQVFDENGHQLKKWYDLGERAANRHWSASKRYARRVARKKQRGTFRSDEWVTLAHPFGEVLRSNNRLASRERTYIIPIIIETSVL